MQVLLLVLEQCLRRLRDEHLPAVAGRADPSGAINRQARVAAAAGDRLARVQAHPHLDLDALGPRMREQSQLTLDGGQERIARAREGDEERVALGVHLVAAVGSKAARNRRWCSARTSRVLISRAA